MADVQSRAATAATGRAGSRRQSSGKRLAEQSMVAVIRRPLLKASRSPLFERCVGRAESRPDNRANLLRVLTYHRIAGAAERPDLAPSLISAAPEDFAAQMEHLAVHYHPLSAQELLDSHQLGRPLPPRSVLVTFDDA